jgi:hypothetical protein
VVQVFPHNTNSSVWYPVVYRLQTPAPASTQYHSPLPASVLFTADDTIRYVPRAVAIAAAAFGASEFVLNGDGPLSVSANVTLYWVETIVKPSISVTYPPEEQTVDPPHSKVSA